MSLPVKLRMAERRPPLRNVPLGAASDDLHQTLWRALSTGAPGASHAVWQAFWPGVRGLLRRLLGPDTETQDLAQEVFLRFFQRSGRVTEGAFLKPFLFGICTRVAQEEMRRRRIHRWLSLTSSGVLPEGASSTEDSGAREAVRNLYRLLERLGPSDRSLFVLRFIEKLELTEVAEIQALSFSTARRRIDRVWKRMRRLIEKDETLLAYLQPEREGRGDLDDR
jgi:RNA polymerase sigma-70 factor (ECF subfamily)